MASMSVHGLPELSRESVALGKLIADGSGGTQVWEAQLLDPVTHHTTNVAVKQFSPASDTDRHACFHEMALHAAAARCAPDVCQPYGWCADASSVYFVMRKYSRSVADKLREGPLTAAELEAYSLQVCRTMAALARCLPPLDFSLPSLDQHSRYPSLFGWPNRVVGEQEQHSAARFKECEPAAGRGRARGSGGFRDGVGAGQGRDERHSRSTPRARSPPPPPCPGRGCIAAPLSECTI